MAPDTPTLATDGQLLSATNARVATRRAAGVPSAVDLARGDGATGGRRAPLAARLRVHAWPRQRAVFHWCGGGMGHRPDRDGHGAPREPSPAAVGVARAAVRPGGDG